MKKTGILILMLILTLVMNTAGAEETALTQAFDLIDCIVSHDIAHGFPSAQIAVMKDGEFLYEKAWGDDIKTDTLFDLASVTKMYSVVYAVQHLVSEGKLDVESTVCNIMGDDFADSVLPIGFGENAPDTELQRAWKRSVTVRDLLLHNGGMNATAEFLYRTDFHFEGTDGNPLYAGNDATEAARERVWQALCKMPLARCPRTEIVYSDVDYVLLCFVVEKVTGTGIDAYLRETFWDPLGLRRITYNPLVNGFSPADCAPTELHGNTRDGLVYFDGIRTETIRGEVHDETAWYAMAGVSGHAGLFANAHDLALLANVMIDNGGYFTDETVETFTGAYSDEHDEWGLG